MNGGAIASPVVPIQSTGLVRVSEEDLVCWAEEFLFRLVLLQWQIVDQSQQQKRRLSRWMRWDDLDHSVIHFHLNSPCVLFHLRYQVLFGRTSGTCPKVGIPKLWKNIYVQFELFPFMSIWAMPGPWQGEVMKNQLRKFPIPLRMRWSIFCFLFSWRYK